MFSEPGLLGPFDLGLSCPGVEAQCNSWCHLVQLQVDYVKGRNHFLFRGIKIRKGYYRKGHSVITVKIKIWT